MAKSKRKKSKNKPTSRKKQLLRVVVSVFLLLLITLGLSYAWFYKLAFKQNLQLSQDKTELIYISTGSNLTDVVNALTQSGWLVDKSSFIWMAEFMNYDDKIKPGRYRLKDGMSNRELVSHLRSGKQEPVKLVLQSLRTTEQLAGRVAQKLEVDSTELSSLLNDSDYLSEFSLKPETAICMFLANTYEFYWNTSADQFIRRMFNEYNKFWSDERLENAKRLGLSKVDAQIIASIVVQESNRRDEWSTIAGVYINRLKIGMALQADPTVKFALQDFELKRVRSVHTQFDSPYNTYKYKGLPPGPIYMTGQQSIDSILNYKSHNYLYFCAKPDRSGYHEFSKSYSKHLINARRYHRSLNARGI